MMKLIIGLGNPGKKYEDTRHNLGFLVVDEIARHIKRKMRRPDLQFKTWRKFNSEVLSLAADILLVKPQTFMNESGSAVGKLAGFYKVEPEDIWVIHDDVDLPLEKIKIVKSRGSAGHQGVASIIKQLGAADFVRLRLGIGHPHAGQRMEGGKKIIKFDTPEEMEDFVLAPFMPTEADEVRKLVKKAVEAISLALKKGIKAAMNRYN
ncbi:MAG TPA: aminoacyl-tRNA hydrolase [Candidatus Bathyarchaeia archaeon]|nr:aminoacyl-tRNA hydrolase [Candidatus Bathyarchaeia archaeon]